MITAIRQIVRSLARVPAFTAVVLVTFALGIGAATAITSVVSHVLLAPLPYPEPTGRSRCGRACPTPRSRSSRWRTPSTSTTAPGAA